MLSNCAALILWNPEASFLRQARTGAFRCKLHAPFFPGRNGWEEGKTIPVKEGGGQAVPMWTPVGLPFPGTAGGNGFLRLCRCFYHAHVFLSVFHFLYINKKAN